MIKLTAVYGHPTDPAAFEKYYVATHMPLVASQVPNSVVERSQFIAASLQ
jgi:uncharacterized protein (TIGR02118 family)